MKRCLQAFERFWRAGESARAGIELAIVQDLVTAHSGRAHLRGALGLGLRTRVTVNLRVDA